MPPIKREYVELEYVELEGDHIDPVYQKLLSQSPTGVLFLYSDRFKDALREPAARAISVYAYNVTVDQAIEELRRLLAIKAYLEDHNATKISPTPLMDSMWHAAILDTRLYAELQEAIGCILHHRPEGASDQEVDSRKMRLQTMEALYTVYFSAKPLTIDVSPPAGLRIRSGQGDAAPSPVFAPPKKKQRGLDKITIYVQYHPAFRRGLSTFHIRPTMTVNDLKFLIAEETGFSAQNPLLFDGSILLYPVLNQNEVHDGSVLYMAPSQVGC